MNTFYYSQTNDKRFYWIKSQQGKWFLMQNRVLKNGKLASTAMERVVFKEPKDISEERLLALFKQAEVDVIFRDAAGIKGEPQKDKLTDY